MDQNIYQNIFTFGITQKNYKIFKSYGEVCIGKFILWKNEVNDRN